MSDPYLGEVRMFTGSYAPESWLLCNGALQPIPGNEALFSLLGTTYGGDGTTTFGIPDYRGRVPVSLGTGMGLTSRALGQTSGTETVALTAANLPAHTHAFNVATAPGTTSTISATTLLATAVNTTGGTNKDAHYIAQSATVGGTFTLAAGAVSSAGGNTPIPNLMPSLAINFIICTAGIYPSPN